jgi:hypothetical protein
MNIEEMYRKMKLDEANDVTKNSVEGDKSVQKLPDQFTSQPAKAEEPKAGNPGGPEKLPDQFTAQPGTPDAGKASKKTSTDAGKTKEDLEPPAGGIGEQPDVTDAKDGKELPVKAKLKAESSEDLQEMGAPVSMKAINKFRKAAPEKASAGKAALSGHAAANARANAPKKTLGNMVKGAVNKVKGALNMGESQIEEMYAKFIAEYEAVLEENGVTEYSEEEAMEFFVEQFGDLFVEAKKEDEDKEDDEDSEDDSDKSDKKEDMKESFQFKLADQLGGLLESEGLTDEFKTQATTIFEAAVNAAAKGHIESIQEQLQEQYESDVAAYKEKLDEQVEKYLDYVVEEWVKENRLAVESAARNNVAESFMAKLKDLLEEHYVQLPEEKADLYEEEVKRAENLEESLNDAIAKQAEMASQIKDLNKKLQVESFVRDFSEIEAEKIRELSEGVEFDSSFGSKLKTLKENYFPSRKPSADMLVEDVPAKVEQPTQKVEGEMGQYLTAMKKIGSMNK